MSSHHTQKRICNCQNPSNTTIFKSYINHSYCEKCGCILIKNIQGVIHYTLKPNKKQQELELNPITIIKSMIKKTEENYPNINYIYNNSDIFYNFKNDYKLNIYLKNRKMLLIKLQNLMKTFGYCDMIFYQCLFYLDTYLRQDIDEEMEEKALLYNLLGYFLCSVKLKETDISEPRFDYFFNLFKGVYLSPNKIGLYEKICLKRINYNIFSYSSYDWIMQLISNGVIFNNEVDITNEIILIKGHRHSLVNAINKYAIKLLLNLTSKNIFFKYSPMYIAISIIQISREKYLDNKMIKPRLFQELIELYGIDYTKIHRCYEELKSIELEKNKNSKELKDDNNKISEEINKTEKKDIKRPSMDIVKNSFSNFLNNKNIFIPNKLFSSNAVISLKDENNNILSENNLHTKSINVNHDSLSRNRLNLKKLNHLSINCEKSSKDSLPIINLKYQNNQKELNTISTNKNYYFSKEKEKERQNNINIEETFSENENEDYKEKINIRTKKVKLSTSVNKLPKLNFDRIMHNKNNNINQFEPNKEYIPVGRLKKYKLKSTKNIGIKDFI